MERRRYLRSPIRFPISFTGENVFGEGSVVDLSKSGLKLTVESQQPVPVGKYLQLLVSLPDTMPPLRVDSAAVRWSRGTMFGVELLYLGDEGVSRLETYLGSLQDKETQ